MKGLFLAAWILSQTTGVTVKGRLIQPPDQQSSARVNMSGASINELRTAAIAADGGFEFLNVQPGVYILKPDSNVAGATSVVIKVEDKDINGIELKVPRIIAGRVTIEGSEPIPPFSLSWSGPAGTINVSVKPAVDGIFHVAAPDGEQQVRVTGLPSGYFVKALSYGSTNLLTDKLAITASDSQLMLIMLATPAPARDSGRNPQIAVVD